MYKVLIRPLQIEDAYISFKWRNDPEIWKYTGSRPDREITIEIEKKWIQSVLKDDSCRRFAILVDEKYIGNIQLTNIINGSAEYHIFIGDKSFWGKGISSLATYEILHYAKEELGLYNVYLSVREDNIFAIKAYKKNSFKTVSVENGWIKMNCNISLLPPPTVSVFVMVYNHEKYIAECLDGILMQKCNFSYNIVVGEDASTDKSREILLEYCKKYPGKFKLLLHEKNIGAMANQNEVFKACNGKYIAVCEGDDYWIDPLKLQKQVDYMERNSRVSILASHYTIYDQEKETFINPPKIKYELNFDTLIKKRNKIATATVCFRREFANQYTEEIKPLEKEWFIGDYSLWLFLSQKGQVKILNNVTTVYRRLLKSASNNQSIEKQFNFYRKINCMIDFYIKRYGCQDNTKIQFEKYKYNLEINYAFNLKNKSIMKQEMIKKRNAGFNVGLKYHIKFFFLLFNMNYIFNSINFQRKKMRLGKNG